MWQWVFKLVSSKRSIRFFLQQGWHLLFISLLLCPHPFLPIVTLHLRLSSFLRFFFFLASTPGWQYFSSRLLHAISLKIIWVKSLAEVRALEEHQLSSLGSALLVPSWVVEWRKSSRLDWVVEVVMGRNGYQIPGSLLTPKCELWKNRLAGK